MAEKNKQEWIGVELADCLGMITNVINPSMKSARLIQNLQTHIKPGALKARPGYTSKYSAPEDTSIKGTTATVTISNGSPCVVTYTNHGLVGGERIRFTTTGGLPTGLAINTYYYVLYLTVNTFNVATTIGGTAINTSSAGSGVHTINVDIFLNFEIFSDRQADPDGEEIICLIQKGIVTALSGSGVTDTQNMLCFWIRPYWKMATSGTISSSTTTTVTTNITTTANQHVGKFLISDDIKKKIVSHTTGANAVFTTEKFETAPTGTLEIWSWDDSWQWLNKTIITRVKVESDPTYPNMIIAFDDFGLSDDALVGWTIYNKTKGQYAKIITSKVQVGHTRICHTAYDSYWEEYDVLLIMKNYVDLTAMAELYSATWDEIQFHKFLNDLRIGFGGKANRPGLMVGYRKKYLMLSEFDFTNVHTDITSAALEAFATINDVVLDTHVADKEAFGIDLVSIVGSLTAGTYYFRLTGLLDEYAEQLLAENQITIAGGDDDIEIYPFAYINKLSSRITRLNIYKSTDKIVWYKIKSNTVRVDEFLNTTWKIDEQGKLIYVESADLITNENAATPTTDFNSIGNWTAKDTWGCTFESEDDDVGQLSPVTMTIASPCVITYANHGLSDGQKIRFYTTGALPTGITADIDYFVKAVDSSTFKIAATQGGADINTSGTQSGSHYLYCGLRTPQNGSYFLLWKNTQFYSMIMKLTSPIITYTTQRVAISFYAKTNVSGIKLKIGSISPYPNPFGGEPDIEYQEITLSNNGSWNLHTVTMDIYGKIVMEANADPSGNIITRIGIDNFVVQSADFLLSGLTDGTEMKSELGYNPIFNIVKGWDQALTFRGRVYYLNPYVEKRYENYILKSHIHSSGSYMYDIASFGEYGEIEKYDSNVCVGMALLPTGEILILKNKSVVIVNLETLSPTEPIYGNSCSSLNSISNINGTIRWCGDEDIYQIISGSGRGIEPILEETIRDLYLAISLSDKTKIMAARDKFNTYRIRIYDATNKTEYVLSKTGWIKEIRNLFPQIYRQNENNILQFLNNGSIYLFNEE